MDRVARRLALTERTNPPVGAGAYRLGNVLLIGEQASNPELDPDQKPFCSMQGSSGWINRQLDLIDAEEAYLFWLNARHNDGREVALVEVAHELQPTAVIALGNVAAKLCEQANVRFIKHYHPQYWKRFHSKERYPLLNELDSILKMFRTRSLRYNPLDDK